MFLGSRISLPSPRHRKRPVCDPHMPMGCSLCTSLCLREALFYEPESIALKDRMGMRHYKSLGKRSTSLSGYPQSYIHTLLVWYQCQDELCLQQPNLEQSGVGNSWILSGWGTGLPPPPPLQNPTANITDHPELLHQMPQCSDAQILTPSLHPPPSHPLRLQQWILLSLLHYCTEQQPRNSFSFQRNQFTIM